MSAAVSSSSNRVSQQLLDQMNGGSSEEASGASQNSSTDLQSTFLELLIAQLQNQDPTTPMDSSQMTSQLAEINMVSGISQLNTSLNSLATQLSQSQEASAASMIGSTVLTPGNQIQVSDGKADGFGVHLANDATNVTVTIKDATGASVGTLNVGSAKAGNVPLSWTAKDNNGNPLPDGTYTFTVTDDEGTGEGTPTSLSEDKVVGVEAAADGSSQFMLASGKNVGFQDIAMIE